MRCYFVFFVFKQKTAYEMRISDWSSDVCSSDLVALFGERRRQRLDADRAAEIVRGEAVQIAPVHRVEPAVVDLEPQQRRIRDLPVDLGAPGDRKSVV